MKEFIKQHPLILMEAAIVEQLRRSSKIQLHPSLVNATCIYDSIGQIEMQRIYQQYIHQAKQADLPMILCTPTWRANQQRVQDSDANSRINQDTVAYMRQFAKDSSVKLGGMIGCKNDCYQPNQALSVEQAEVFHDWQIQQLAETDVDFLIAVTLPNVNEALGIAKAMAKTDKPYIISFVISRDGLILDGTPLLDAIELIDANTQTPPLGYMVNCAYPTFLCADQQDPALWSRFIGFQANASSLDHCALDNADALQMDQVSDWGQEMLRLNQDFGVKLLGGCCGTGSEHLEYIIEQR